TGKDIEPSLGVADILLAVQLRLDILHGSGHYFGTEPRHLRRVEHAVRGDRTRREEAAEECEETVAREFAPRDGPPKRRQLIPAGVRRWTGGDLHASLFLPGARRCA